MDATSLVQTAASAAAGQQYPAGALYVVGTPIGNLADITLRAIHVLSLVDMVACEDTRMTQRLLQHLGLSKRLLALHEHNEHQASAQVIEALKAGQRVAYVSDAGTPAVSDPGARLVHAATDAGLRAMPIPGASAVVSMVSVAGDTVAQGFSFVGFLPTKGALRKSVLSTLVNATSAQVLFESPHRVMDLAQDLARLDPQRWLTIGRELTKQFEEVARLRAADWPQWLKEGGRERGEFVLVWHARAPVDPDEAGDLPDAVQTTLMTLADHMPVKEACRLVAELTGRSAKALYAQVLKARQGLPDH